MVRQGCTERSKLIILPDFESRKCTLLIRRSLTRNKEDTYKENQERKVTENSISGPGDVGTLDTVRKD